MLFALRTRWDQGTMYYMGLQIPSWEGAILRGEGASSCKVWGHAAVIYAKMAEAIEMPFGLWTRMG